jgi:hypothetical protein
VGGGRAGWSGGALRSPVSGTPRPPLLVIAGPALRRHHHRHRRTRTPCPCPWVWWASASRRGPAPGRKALEGGWTGGAAAWNVASGGSTRAAEGAERTAAAAAVAAAAFSKLNSTNARYVSAAGTAREHEPVPVHGGAGCAGHLSHGLRVAQLRGSRAEPAQL